MAAPTQSAQLTKFPFGLSSFGMPVIGGGAIMTTGRVFFVDSTASAKGDDISHGTEPTTPFATIDFAIGQCGANRGDTILVLPGHTETLTSAAGINADVAGVSIIAVSPSQGRDRATVTLSTSTAASIDVNAANVYIDGLVISMVGIDAIVSGINVKASDCTIRNCEFITATAAGQAVCALTTNANAHRMEISDCFFNGSSDAGSSFGIFMQAGPLTDVEIGANRFVGAWLTSTGAAIWADAAHTNLFIHHNVFVTLGTAQTGIEIDNGSCQGVIASNQFVGTSLALLLENNAMASIQNYGSQPSSLNSPSVLLPPYGTQLGSARSIYDEIIGAEMSYNRGNYLAVTADFTSVTWNTIATHELFTITGTVRIKILPVCGTDLTSGGAATVSLGIETAGTNLIAATTGTAIDAGHTWLTTTPAFSFAKTSVIDQIISGGKDIGLAVAAVALTGGSIVFHCWWEPLDSAGAVVAGAGGTL